MAFSFSQNLRDKTITYFRRHFAEEISPEQADEYLNSMADLYILFSVEKKE